MKIRNPAIRPTITVARFANIGSIIDEYENANPKEKGSADGNIPLNDGEDWSVGHNSLDLKKLCS